MELISKEAIKNEADVVFVLVDTLRKNEDVVKVDKHARVQQIKKHTMHSTLKGAGRVTKPKRHNTKLKLSITRTERCFKLISSVHG